jgi:hypothetical protein
VKAVFVQVSRRHFAGGTGGGAFMTKCAAVASASTLIGKGLVFVKTNVYAFASHAHAQEVCSKSLPVCVPLTLFEGPHVFRKQCSTQTSTTRCDHFGFAMLLDACRLQVKPSYTLNIALVHHAQFSAQRGSGLRVPAALQHFEDTPMGVKHGGMLSAPVSHLATHTITYSEIYEALQLSR